MKNFSRSNIAIPRAQSEPVQIRSLARKTPVKRETQTARTFIVVRERSNRASRHGIAVPSQRNRGYNTDTC